MVSVRLVALASVKTAARRTSSGTSSSSESPEARIHRSIILSIASFASSSIGAGLSSGGRCCCSSDLQCVLWATEGREGGLPPGRGQPGGRSRRRGQRRQQG
ncbi:unnamed protein product, partial [Ectocarpus sp. 13 AM-2016]